jgi:dephospho-CoA kinase
MEESLGKRGEVCETHSDDAVRAAYETGAHSYQFVAKEFGSILTTARRIVRQAMRGGSTREKIAGDPLVL